MLASKLRIWWYVIFSPLNCIIIYCYPIRKLDSVVPSNESATIKKSNNNREIYFPELPVQTSKVFCFWSKYKIARTNLVRTYFNAFLCILASCSLHYKLKPYQVSVIIQLFPMKNPYFWRFLHAQLNSSEYFSRCVCI